MLDWRINHEYTNLLSYISKSRSAEQTRRGTFFLKTEILFASVGISPERKPQDLVQLN